MRTSIYNEYEHDCGPTGAPSEPLHQRKAHVRRLRDLARRHLHRSVVAVRAWAQKRRDARVLARFPDAALEDLGFRRVDICGRPVGGRSWINGYGDIPVRIFTPLTPYPAVIERIDEYTPRGTASAGAARQSKGSYKQPMEWIIERVKTMSKHAGQKIPQIARIWRGRTLRERADDYEAYLYTAGIKPLIEKAMGVQSLREDRDGETEFVTISYWESVEAMTRFTDGEPTRIHHLERDPEFLIELPEQVQILRIKASHGNTGGDAASEKA